MVRNSGSEPDSSGVKPLFTVGHSNLDFPEFVKLLRDSNVELLIDVRSRPHSSRFPQFSQPGFEKMILLDESRVEGYGLVKGESNRPDP